MSIFAVIFDLKKQRTPHSHGDGADATRRRINVFFPCNTKAAVKRAAALLDLHWPAGRALAIFVHGTSGALPPGFVENPDATWAAYSIVCVSPRIQVGVSFTRPNHFHMTLAYACTVTTSADDFLQSLMRVRCPVAVLCYRVCNRSGQAQSAAPTPAEQADDALFAYCVERDIQRAHLPPSYPAQHSELLGWLRTQCESEIDWQRRHYLAIVQRSLRQRQMTIQLGGIHDHQTLTVIG
jgi:hypothetical protein